MPQDRELYRDMKDYVGLEDDGCLAIMDVFMDQKTQYCRKDLSYPFSSNCSVDSVQSQLKPRSHFY